tara:strand:- start:1456 stop:1704 length:249 start_codon:yes stop_codon:yes gene_type:complete
MDIRDKIVTEEHVSMTFCANCKNCPSVNLDANSDDVVVGGEDEGFTVFTKEQFRLFVKEAKNGVFDKILGEPNGNSDAEPNG